MKFKLYLILLVNVLLISNVVAENVTSIIEFFSFGCPHCYKVEPVLQRIIANKNIKYVPVVMIEDSSQVAVSAIYTACQIKGIGAIFRSTYFNAVFLEGYPAYSPITVNHVLAVIGANSKEIVAMAQSDIVKNKLVFDKYLMNRFQVSSTPTFVINGTNVLEGDNALSSIQITN